MPSRNVATGLKRGEDSSSSEYFASTAAADRVEANSLLSARIRELEKERDEHRSADAAAALDRIAFFRKFHDSIFIRNFDYSPKDNSVKLTSEMEGILGLTKAEKEAV